MQPAGLVGAFHVLILNLNNSTSARGILTFLCVGAGNYSTGREFYIMIDLRATVERATARDVASLRVEA